MNNLRIIIEGNPGSGKTAFVRALKKAIESTNLFDSVISYRTIIINDETYHYCDGNERSKNFGTIEISTRQILY